MNGISFRSVSIRIRNLFIFIAGLALLAMMLVSAADIVGRSLLDMPVEGSSTIISELLFPICVFFSLPYIASRAGHIRVDFLDRLAAPIERFRALIFALLIFGFWAMIAWKAGGRAIEAYLLNQRPIGAVGIPAAWSYGVVALGSGAAALAHLVWMFVKPSHASPTEDQG